VSSLCPRREDGLSAYGKSQVTAKVATPLVVCPGDGRPMTNPSDSTPSPERKERDRVADSGVPFVLVTSTVTVNDAETGDDDHRAGLATIVADSLPTSNGGDRGRTLAAGFSAVNV